ncbi:MAG: phosphatidate cytidylyltransferase [Planctomycetaceae bacterium TMED240]|nr:phosphatidate cytidylyltransferase [Rhodopirellula sp.]OUX08306.1 MAG: phosphatidate cytidylyltransferase [Planctomycetaceae bacterium TMED240]
MSHIAWEIRITLIAIFAVLAVLNCLLFIKMRCYPDDDDTLIRHRIRTWWSLAGLFSLALCVSPNGGAIFFGFISFFALKEFLSMSPTRRADRRVLFYAYLSVIPQYYFATSDNYQMFLVFIPVIMFSWLPTRMWMIGEVEGFQKAAGTLLWALMITVYSLSHTAYLLTNPLTQNASNGAVDAVNLTGQHPGPGLLIFLIIMAETNDIFQYVSGRPLGKKQVSPNIAPGKTYAGLFGGITLTTCLAGSVGPLITPMDLTHSMLAGCMIACMGFAGELCIGALKRDLKITNFGATLPGHGGVLDRVGNLIFTAPLFFHFIHYCYHQ